MDTDLKSYFETPSSFTSYSFKAHYAVRMAISCEGGMSYGHIDAPWIGDVGTGILSLVSYFFNSHFVLFYE